MPSSTSSSNSLHRLPVKPWGVIWAVALALTIAALGGLELFWRARGATPSVNDDPALWAYHRRRLEGAGPKSVALLGASRMQLGFSTETFHRRFPDFLLADLAVPGGSPLATLRDLAADDEFRGVVLCDLTTNGLFAGAWDDQQPYVNAYHNDAFYNRLESPLSAMVVSRFVVLRSDLNLLVVSNRLAAGNGFPEHYLTTLFDRSVLADYTKVNIARHRKNRLRDWQEAEREPLPTEEAFISQVRTVDGWVKAIEKRGGRVVFVRFPTSGEGLKLTEAKWPREKFWDVFAKLTSAETIHFQDVPTLADTVCPDDSHIDFRDSPEFTNDLLDEIEKRGIFADL